jgi:hypothetical protein
MVKDIRKVTWAAIGFECMALFGMLIPAIHGFAGLMDIEIMQGKSFTQLPVTISYMYRFSNYFAEPGIIICILVCAWSFPAVESLLKTSGIKNVPSTKAVVGALILYALTRVPMILSGMNFVDKLDTYLVDQNAQALQMGGLFKGLSAISFALGAMGATIFLFRFFNHDACLYNGKNPGNTGTKLLLWTIPVGVISKALAVYYYADFFTAIFIVSMMVKSLGLSYISLHLFLLAYNQKQTGYTG